MTFKLIHIWTKLRPYCIKRWCKAEPQNKEKWYKRICMAEGRFREESEKMTNNRAIKQGEMGK